MAAISELGLGEGTPPSPEQLQAQGAAIINRVKEFFDGVDTSVIGAHKNGLVDIHIYDFVFGGFRVVKAVINGYIPAEMHIYDSAIGMHPYYRNHPKDTPKATYFLRGQTGHDGDFDSEASVAEFDSGMELFTRSKRNSGVREVTHKVGITPQYLSEINFSRPHLMRPVEEGILRGLGIKI